MRTNRLLEMSGQRKQALALAEIVQQWKQAYNESPTKETKNVHNSLCDLLEVLNSWLLENEGEARIAGSYHLGPTQKTWSKIR